MAIPEKQKRYHAKHIRRVNLDMQKTFYDELKACADELGEPVNTFIKKAIRTRIDTINTDAF